MEGVGVAFGPSLPLLLKSESKTPKVPAKRTKRWREASARVWPTDPFSSPPPRSTGPEFSPLFPPEGKPYPCWKEPPGPSGSGAAEGAARALRGCQAEAAGRAPRLIYAAVVGVTRGKKEMYNESVSVSRNILMEQSDVFLILCKKPCRLPNID